MNVLTYTQDVDEFIKALDLSTGAKVVRSVELLKHYGHLLGMPRSQSLTKP